MDGTRRRSAGCPSVVHLLFSIFVFLLPTAGPSRGAVIRTLDGKVYDGGVAIDPKGFLLVNQRVGSVAKVLPQDLLDVRFAGAATPTGAEALPMKRGVVLTDGSAIAADGGVKRADDATVVITRGGADVSIPTSRVARIIFRPLSARLLAKAPPGHTGALLDTGDFSEGDFKGWAGGRVRISSVLFGLQEFDGQSQARAVILADVQPAASPWVVRLADGSVLLARAVRLAGDKFGFDVPNGPPVSAGVKELISIECGPDRVQPLTDLKPDGVDPPAGYDAASAVTPDATPAGIAPVLTDVAPARCLGVAAGASVTYRLDGRYRTLLCRCGVPAALAPVAKVSFAVVADGKEVYHSVERTAVDDAATVCVNVSGVATLVLRVESDVPAELGAIGVWADPELVKVGEGRETR